MNAAKNSRKNKNNRNNTRRKNSHPSLLKIPDEYDLNKGIHFLDIRGYSDFLFWITEPSQRSILKVYCDSAGLQSYFENNINKILQAGYIFQISVNKEKYITGFAILDNKLRNIITILEICVGVKRGGIGRQMIEACVEFGKRRGVTEIDIEAVAYVIDFYTKLGFKDKYKSNSDETCASVRREIQAYKEWSEDFSRKMGNHHEYYIQMYFDLENKRKEYNKYKMEIDFARMDMDKWKRKYEALQKKTTNADKLQTAKEDMEGAEEDFHTAVSEFETIRPVFESSHAEWNEVVEELKAHGFSERSVLNPPHPRNCHMVLKI